MTMATQNERGVHERVETYLQRSGLGPRVTRMVPLTGDASDRRYIRLLLQGGSSMVLAVHTGPIRYATNPFVNVATLFAQMSIPVPAISGHDDELGILALQDLGDVTLQAHLGAAAAAEHRALYRQSVDLIVTIQRRGRECASDAYLPFGIAFDVEKLTWEMDFFVKHFLEAYRGARIGDAERASLRREFGHIVEELAAEPRVLCHRDYHSRNLMLHDGCLYVIDFQDARMGPDTYDLVSLLRDSYVDLTEEEVGDLLAHFMTQSNHGSAREDFRRRFDVMSLQRNLKALGTFGYQTATRRNPVYIQYIPRTIRYVRNNLARYERFSMLRNLLAAHLEELR
ncbi:MAG: aminoglycoside phosphotransferase family protein [Vicinamibacterales bacterium]